MRYRVFNPFEVDVVWNKVSPWIMQSLLESKYQFPNELNEDLIYIKNSLLQGNMQLWIGAENQTPEFDLVMVTEPGIYAGKKILIVRWLSGRAVDRAFDISVLESWAQKQGFYAIHVHGRKGWERRLKPFGYEHEYTTISRILNQGVH